MDPGFLELDTSSEMSDHIHALVALALGKISGYQLDSRLSGPP
jgi:hypothetical protein